MQTTSSSARAAVAVACALALATCTVFTSLDDLKEPSSDAGAAGPGAGGSSSSSSSSAGVGGAGVGASAPGAGGAAGGSTAAVGGAGGGGGATDPSAVYRDVVLADDPLAYWRFGEPAGPTAVDEAGDHDGAYAGPVTLGMEGILPGNTAAGFDYQLTGAEARVTVGDVLGFEGASAFTIEAWVKPYVIDAQHRRILEKVGAIGGSTEGYLLKLGGGAEGLVFYRYGGGADDYLSYPGTANDVPLMVFSHVVATFDGTVLLLYVNGEQVAAAVSQGLSIADTDSVLSVGGSANGNYPFAGVLDEVALYDKALAKDRIAAHYQAGAP